MGQTERAENPRPSGLQKVASGADGKMKSIPPSGGFVTREKSNTVQKQAARKTTALLGLVILVLLGFAFTVQTLWVSLVRSGFLGDNIPAGGWMILVGLVGLTVLFCLYILHQQGEISRFRARLVSEQMELEQSRSRLAELTSLFQLGNSLHMDLALD